ncbi:MAG: VOC family protein [Chloroflexia bacterium]|nr:VOC family protein [Chloroflexia bacterium]
MIRDIGHPAFAAYDVEKTLEFYAQLGIGESFRLHKDDGSLMLIYLHVAGDRFIEVFPNGPEPDPERRQSFRHLCLLTGDLDGTVEALRSQGVTIDREPTQGLDHNMQAWIADPDGNAIELMQLSEESPQREVTRSSTVQE